MSSSKKVLFFLKKRQDIDSSPMINRRFCTAPLMDWSDRHCRQFWRTISPNAHLYTEMVTSGAILHGDKERHLRFDPAEHTVALQLGGSDPKELAQCARIGQTFGYDEINLNVGCPSDRVQNGMIGAILMRHAPLVKDCISAMQDACDIDVTVKHRIGVDDMEDYSGLRDFVGTVAKSGCKTFIIHARKAWLKGLSPKENRDIPPLDYPLVYRIKREFPELEIIINGGITTIDDCTEHLAHVDGVMLGREAYQNPMILVAAEQYLFGNEHYQPSRRDILERFLPYVETQLEQGVALHHITRHILGLYHAVPGGKMFRRTLSQRAHLASSDASLITEAMTTAEIAATSPRAKSAQF